MSLHEDLERPLQEKEHKLRKGRIVAFIILSILIILLLIRAMMLFFFSNSWIAKHIFNW